MVQGYRPPTPVIERFLSKVIKGEHEGDCWIWTGAKNPRGYGAIGVGSRIDGSRGRVAVHRFSFEFFYGEDVGNYHVLHSCHNPSCVNPAHLRMGTHQENMKDMMRAGRQPKNIGEKNPNAILSSCQVKEIRKRWSRHVPHEEDGNSSSEMAREFGVTRGAILHIVTDKSWRSV